MRWHAKAARLRHRRHDQTAIVRWRLGWSAIADARHCGGGIAPRSLVDIGAGAGFPGLPLKILCPELQLTLVESIAKKATFLRHMIDALGLTNVEIVVARAEAAGRDPAQRERYDVAVARAVAELRVLAEYCLPFCRIGGRFFAPKGARIEGELQAALPAITQLGGRL